MSRTGRMIVGIAASMVAIYLSVSVIAGILLANLAVHPERRPLLQKFELLSASSNPTYGSVQTISITATDGAMLKAWYIQPKDFRGASVILLHGMADNREGVEGYALMFLHHGYAVLMPDSRAHGKSGGEIATYGVLERNDIKQWSEWLRSSTPDCEYLFGESMGAAISIQASATIPGLCAVVAEDPFESFREIAYDRIAQQTGLSEPKASILGFPAVEAGLLYAKLRYGVYLADANPIESLTHSKVPTLLITGTADSNIPMRHSIALNKAAPNHTDLWIVYGAGHTGAMAANPYAFEEHVTEWFAKYDSPLTN